MTLENLEYLVEDEGTVRLKEVMFRQFGWGADPNVYGNLPPRLRVDCEKGLEYRWTKMLQEDFEARGWLRACLGCTAIALFNFGRSHSWINSGHIYSSQVHSEKFRKLPQIKSHLHMCS